MVPNGHGSKAVTGNWTAGVVVLSIHRSGHSFRGYPIFDPCPPVTLVFWCDLRALGPGSNWLSIDLSLPGELILGVFSPCFEPTRSPQIAPKGAARKFRRPLAELKSTRQVFLGAVQVPEVTATESMVPLGGLDMNC